MFLLQWFASTDPFFTNPLQKYHWQARLDRRDGRAGGSIAVFDLNKTNCHRSWLKNAGTLERTWLLLHSEQGPVLLRVSYRPPTPGEIAPIHRFASERNEIEHMAMAKIIVDDLIWMFIIPGG